MNYNEFCVLNTLYKNPGRTQREIASANSVSIGTVNNTIKSLTAQGLLDASGAVSVEGFAALEPYKVKNAVIMAAGISSRFAPISYERPKGVLTVRGEVLIERQIEQLKDAGIEDITVVIGYKKEEFFYLEDAFGVKLVNNEEYATRNNNSTIKRVEGILGNTYICSSDDYFSINPFEKYVYDSYYASEYRNGPTDEYCLTTKGKGGLIVDVKVGGADSWVMLGHAYWDESYAKKFVEILEREYDNPETAGKLWEDIYAEHIPELPMRIRKYPSDAIWEFDSLDELRGFDPHFIENVDSGILDNICSVLECERDDVKKFEPIKQGLTNLSVRFEAKGIPYVYRHPGTGTDAIISRESEAYSQGVARDLGIDRTFVFEDPKTGWKISRFIEGCIEFDYHNVEHVKTAMAIGRKLHQSGAKSSFTFDVYQNALEIVDLLGKVSFADFDELAERAEFLNECVKSDGVPLVLCHNDFYAPNFLVHPEGMDLIDWEYSAMSDYASDLGTFICCSDYGIPEAEDAIREYFQRDPDPSEIRHCMAYVGLSAYYWFVWALYKDRTGDPVGEWLYLWYRMAKTFGIHAQALYQA